MQSFLASLLLVVAITASAQTGQPQPGGTITGVVTNNDGDPIEGATLCTSYTTATGSGTSCGGTQTDSHGQFQIHVPLGEVGVYAEKTTAGYWFPATDNGMPPALENRMPPRKAAGIKTVTLTTDSPTAKVVVKIGPRPGELKFSVKDKATGKQVEHFGVRWIAMDNARMMSMEIPTPTFIPPDVDVIVVIQAQGYRRWFYIDPSTSQPTLRLSSGEVKELEVELLAKKCNSPASLDRRTGSRIDTKTWEDRKECRCS